MTLEDTEPLIKSHSMFWCEIRTRLGRNGTAGSAAIRTLAVIRGMPSSGSRFPTVDLTLSRLIVPPLIRAIGYAGFPCNDGPPLFVPSRGTETRSFVRMLIIVQAERTTKIGKGP